MLYAYEAFAVLVFIGMLALDASQLTRRREKPARANRYKPAALVIVPCKGIDPHLEENLRSIAHQSYGQYKVVAVVDSASDPAAKHIRSAGIECISSNYRKSSRSGKVAAILFAIKKYPRYGAYVIADSDIRVGPNWLSGLIAPLSIGSIGLSTTFPKFVPRRGFWSKVKLVWGFVGEGLMENEGTRFGWGGSMAFRRSLLSGQALAFLKSSRYSVSDDISITKAAKSAGLGIAYVKGIQPSVYSYENLPMLIEWSNRQTALTLLGYRKAFYYGIAFYLGEITLFISGIALAAAVSPAFIILLLHFLKSEAKTYIRAESADPAIALIVVLMPFFYLANLVYASRMRHISWRGRRYEIKRQ